MADLIQVYLLGLKHKKDNKMNDDTKQLNEQIQIEAQHPLRKNNRP